MLENNESVNIKVYNHKTNKIVSAPIEDIIKKIIPVQVPIDMHIELIKVQAIIIRTQIVRIAKLFGGKGCTKYTGCDICDDGHCFKMADESHLKKIWKDKYKEYMEKINKALKETEDLIITVKNKPIDPKYHSTCGGSTENSENVIGNEVVYLRRVLCDRCYNSPYWDKYRDITVEEIEERLNMNFPMLSSNLQCEIKGFIEDIIRDENGRVKSVKIGGKNYKGKDIVKILDLNSTRFSIAPVVIRFYTRGKGHGLGLCQYGGNQMAMEGYSYNDIINYYYTGVEIKKYEKPCINKPLKGKIIVIDPGHGGDNSEDARGINGLREKDVVLNISKKLKELLVEVGAKVYLTREEDEYVSLVERAKLGNEKRPNFFISIHLNSFPSSSIRGCEIYHYRNDKDSETLGKSIMKYMVKNLNTVDRGVKTADFFLLREVNVSSIHLEVDYITNGEIEKKLSDQSYINKIAHSIAEGIIGYYKY